MSRSRFTAILTVATLVAPTACHAIELRMNFSALGEYFRFNNIAFGSAEFSLQVDDQQVASAALVTEAGQLPTVSGGFAGEPIPSGTQWGVIDTTFSATFEMDVDSTAALEAGFSINGVRMVMDFNDDVNWISNTGGPGPLATDPRPEGIFLESITLANGDPLSTAGLAFEFVNSQTQLRAEASDFGTGDGGFDTDTSGPPIASVNASNVAFAEIEIGGANVVRWSVSYDPNPLPADIASAAIVNPGIPNPTLQNIRLFTVATSTAGDFSGDGAVDNTDLNLLLANWGAAASPLPANWLGTPPTGASIDNDELNSLLANWGTGVAIPEPATALPSLLVTALCCASRKRVSEHVELTAVD